MVFIFALPNLAPGYMAAIRGINTKELLDTRLHGKAQLHAIKRLDKNALSPRSIFDLAEVGW